MVAALSSMTGFARVEGRVDGFDWAWELKSVNGKSLDLRFRLPPGFDALEPGLKVLVGEQVRRGTISASLSVGEADRAPTLRLNEAVLKQVIDIIGALEGRLDAAPPRLDGLLAIRGVMELGEAEPAPELRAARQDAVAAGFAAALAGLTLSREAEGARLGRILGERLDEIAALVAEAERAAQLQPAAIRARFARQVALLFDGVPPLPAERLAQEVALLIQRADIREELDRLSAHIGAARDLLAEAAGVGRRLDFLCQEFNREANTLCSKAAELDLTRQGLALKAAIEQLREQIQNLE
jgi:uncharacterized protein (TIGR00255 family)